MREVDIQKIAIFRRSHISYRLIMYSFAHVFHHVHDAAGWVGFGFFFCCFVFLRREALPAFVRVCPLVRPHVYTEEPISR